MPLTPDDLDRYAETYYLAVVADLDIEERAQRHSIPLLLRALDGCDVSEAGPHLSRREYGPEQHEP